MTKVLVTEPVHKDGLALLEEKGFTLIVNGSWIHKSWANILKILRLFCAHRHPDCGFHVTDAHLKIVAKHGVGCDTIDVAYARAIIISPLRLPVMAMPLRWLNIR